LPVLNTVKETPKATKLNYSNSNLWVLLNANRDELVTPPKMKIAKDLASRIPRIVKTPAKLREEIATLGLKNTIADNMGRKHSM